VLAGVLFDLDGTLLDIDIDEFLQRYFQALSPAIADILGNHDQPHAGLEAVLSGTRAMWAPHYGRTNKEVFEEHFLELTGVDLTLEPAAAALARFYAEEFPLLRGSSGPTPGARECVTRALDLGLKVAIATNPIFPRAAIVERMRWADVADLPIHVVTSYENMFATKPLATYFAQTAEMLGTAPSKALMVGDDRALDMAASDIGMYTYYVGTDDPPPVDYSGDLLELAELLPRLIQSSAR
jgi:FMN phosphatase YigB (HAD superfamily)